MCYYITVIQRRGRWCAAHVQVAWKIHKHKLSKISDAAAFRASLDAAEVASLRAGFGAAEAASLRAGLNAAEVASYRAGLSSNGLSAAEAASLRAGFGAVQQSADHLRSGLLGSLAGAGPGDIHPGLLGQG
jgi:Autism susceptibility gene 2 protein